MSCFCILSPIITSNGPLVFARLQCTCTKIIFEVTLDNATAENEIMTNVENTSHNTNDDAMAISSEGNISNEYTHVTDELTLPKYKAKRPRLT